MLTIDNTIVCEWWRYDEIGWSRHRLAARTESEAMAVIREFSGGTPYAYAVVAWLGQPELDESPARKHPGTIVSRIIEGMGDEVSEWRVRSESGGRPPTVRAGEPVDRTGQTGRMGRFYR